MADSTELPGASTPTTPELQDAHWQSFKAGFIFERQLWLIRMRWIAIGCIVLTLALASARGWVHDAGALFLITLAMAVYNGYFQLHRRQQQNKESLSVDENSVFPPILCDLAALALLLHWSGGIQNPFALFFVFHTAIGATFLSPWRAHTLGATTLFLWASIVWLEHVGVLHHHPLFLDASQTELLYLWTPTALALAGYLVAFGMMLFGVIYFVQTAERGRRRAEARAFYRTRQSMASERMARIGEITAGVAHTVRNPLQGVINCLDLLRGLDIGEDKERVDIFELMEEGLQRVERVTRRLLVLSRKREFQMAPGELSGLVETSLRFLRAAAQEAEIALEVQMADLPTVAFDPEAMNEALVSIIDNAVGACSTGDRIEVRTEALQDNPQYVCLCVQDNGPGISDELIEKVFDPFFTTKSVGEGTGLGLAIAREIIEGHQGTLTVSSTLAEGTCFRIILPITQ